MSRVYALAKRKDAIGVNVGVTEPYWVELLAVGKRNVPLKYTVANEYISARIADFLGLPVPPYGLFQMKGTAPEVWFASLDYRLTGQSLPPIDPDECFQDFPDETTGVVVFDTWIANTDRHEKNINIDKPPNRSPRLNVFDHGHALLGIHGSERLTKLQTELGILDTTDHGANRHCLIDSITNDHHFEKWLTRIGSFPNYIIEEACEAVLDLSLLTAAECSAVKDFLFYRKEKIGSIVRQSLSEFRKLRQLSLSWQVRDNAAASSSVK